jgi:hypothetical protein
VRIPEQEFTGPQASSKLRMVTLNWEDKSFHFDHDICFSKLAQHKTIVRKSPVNGVGFGGKEKNGRVSVVWL